MDQFYIVVIVKPTDTECETGYRSTNPIAPEQSLASPQDGNALLSFSITLDRLYSF